ncbi:MAG: NAD(+) synthase [Ruthenibacterium sp.]
MEYGFVKVAAVTPPLRVADCAYNTEQIIIKMNEAAAQNAEVICFPELCITGYTCGDLFLQPVLLQGALAGLEKIRAASEKTAALIAVGLPLSFCGKLYNCAAVLFGGKILGVVPKTSLPNYGEFYEKRHFTPAPQTNGSIDLCGTSVLFGTQLLFACETMPALKIGIEICEDLWVPLAPSTAHALAGATVLLNLSASDEIIGKAEYRRALVSGQSAKLISGYVYCDAGGGESSTDLVFSGHNLIAENGNLLAESVLFKNGILISEIDVEKLTNERMKNTGFDMTENSRYQTILFSLPKKPAALTRTFSPFPFVPDDEKVRKQRCESILQMQASGLAKRMEHTHCKTALIGISGGLDSSLAMLVIVKAFEQMHRPLTDIIAVTMPCFGTTDRTRSNAEKQCHALGITMQTVDITKTVMSNFADIQQDFNTHDVTFENTQARVRTLVLMNLANRLNGLVVGTGDLSELALGWATYNGDHMSMYGVNASVPKTLVRYLVGAVADSTENKLLASVLHDILATPVSPELLPAENGTISQQTEEIVGPYALHDFFLYYAIRWAFSPAKIFYLAKQAFAAQYSDAVLLKWLRNFYRRFFAQQFKRSCLPDGPKVGSVTLSPRGDWRMPSDAVAALWLAELDILQEKCEKEEQ